jgi:hypothetical protein
MHIEVLVEDSSGALLVKTLLPRVLGPEGAPHTWRVHSYKGIGHIPKGLTGKADPAKRALLSQLPRLLAAYGKTPGCDNVVVVVDSDTRNCKQFLVRQISEWTAPHSSQPRWPVYSKIIATSARIHWV